jgi:anthranilate phosphoribosyltransferase
MTFDEAETLFGRMLDGEMSDAETRDTLITLSERGETAAEIAGAASAMRARMIAISAPAGAIDVCGTGGDGSHSLNVSTAVAIVVAACGVAVAKHGNRAASSKAGAADTLEALGLDLNRASETAEATLADLGLCFLFAQKHHPALARLAPIRKAIGRRTIFNLTGPAANPARVTRQLIGIARPDYLPIYAEALGLLGTQDFMLVAGDEPLDELSVSGPSTIVSPRGTRRITPEGAGLERHPPEALRGGEATHNAVALRGLLGGEEGAYRDAVLLNSAGALIVAGHATDWRDGVEEATEAIDKGLAKALLDCWIAY